MFNTTLNIMANKFIDWIDRKGVPVMGFIVMALLGLLLAVTVVRMLFPF